MAPLLEPSAYRGLHRYCLTICTSHRALAFREDPVVESVLWQLRQLAAAYGFAIHAYCFMPQHVHLVLEGLWASSDFRRFVRDWKQRTGSAYRETVGTDLWHRGYFDHVLRKDDDTDMVSRYVLAHPVRAGLVADIHQYRYAGSDTSTIEGLLERAAEADQRRAGVS